MCGAKSAYVRKLEFRANISISFTSKSDCKQRRHCRKVGFWLHGSRMVAQGNIQEVTNKDVP